MNKRNEDPGVDIMSRIFWTTMLLATIVFPQTILLGYDLSDRELLTFKNVKNLGNVDFSGFYNVDQITNAFTWADFSFTRYSRESSVISFVDGIIEGADGLPFVARIKIFICKNSSEALDELLQDIVSSSAPIDLIIASHEITNVLGNVCIVPMGKKNRAYYTRGNVACCINILSGEQNAMEVLRHFDAHLFLPDSASREPP